MTELKVNPEVEVSNWISAFNIAFKDCDKTAICALFGEECYWRDLNAMTWSIVTIDGQDKIGSTMVVALQDMEVSPFKLDPSLLKPRTSTVAEIPCIEAAFRFDTVNGPGLGVLRLKYPSGEKEPAKAWTISTLLDMDRIRKLRNPTDDEDGGHKVDFKQPSWPKLRAQELEYTDREPDVLVVGGGHSGVSAAAELKQLGFDALIIDRHPRVGDNWRLRYDGLKLHNKYVVNHFRYMQFPQVGPLYLPKDKVANWIEFYVDALDLNFWTGSPLESAEYNKKTGRWSAVVGRPDGSMRTLTPKHIIMATSVSGTPNIPDLPTSESFSGPVIHSSNFGNGADWTGRSVLVIGSATSAHDICQQLHSHGAKATMVQRGPTLVMSVEPSSELYDGIYSGDGPPLEIRDLLNSSFPFPVTKQAHQVITKKVKEIEAPLYAKLSAVGFQLDFGEDDTGWPFKFRNFGGGYYLNVGCSDLIADRVVGLIQANDIDHYEATGPRMKDGTLLEFDAIVFATGYKGHAYLIRQLFGDDVADKVGRVWGIDENYHEMRNMWTKTGQPGLWFTGGAFSMSRIYSRFMALQIDAIESGRLEK